MWASAEEDRTKGGGSREARPELTTLMKRRVPVCLDAARTETLYGRITNVYFH